MPLSGPLGQSLSCENGHRSGDYCWFSRNKLPSRPCSDHDETRSSPTRRPLSLLFPDGAPHAPGNGVSDSTSVRDIPTVADSARLLAPGWVSPDPICVVRKTLESRDHCPSTRIPWPTTESQAKQKAHFINARSTTPCNSLASICSKPARVTTVKIMNGPIIPSKFPK
jgi:hypothetical protein